jgi:hypothetical protein
MADCSPSIPGFCFPTTVVVGSTDTVAHGPVSVSKAQVQAADAASSSTTMSQTGGFFIITTIIQAGGFDKSEKVLAYQGAGNSNMIIVAKLTGSASQDALVYSDILQNGSFENGTSRWQFIGDSQHSASVVSRYPSGRGFDDGNPDNLDVPHGTRMLHMIKAGETGVGSLVQDCFEFSHTSLLGDFSFSVAPDSAFNGFGGATAGRQAVVALQFFNGAVHQYGIAYTLGGNPSSVPPGFPTINRTIGLTHPGADTFQRFTRDLEADILGDFYYTSVRIWVTTDMEDTIFLAEFDTLWDWFTLETGKVQPELFETSVDEKLIITTTTEKVSTKNFLGVLGTAETYERDFDRSPFFFTPGEIDPNAERDRREVEPFLLFSDAFLRTYEALRASPHTGIVIADKGEDFSSDQLADENVINNGSFETGTTAFWQTDVGTGGSITIQEESTDTERGGGGTGIPAGIPAPDGRFWIYIAKDNQGGDSAYFKQTVALAQTYSSRVARRISWHGLFDYTSGTERRNQLSFVFYNNEETTYHLRYLFGSQGIPVLPAAFPDAPINTSKTLSATEDIVNTYLQQFLEDTDQAIFDFDRMDVWWIADSTNTNETNTYVDDITFTMAIPSEQLLKTTDLAHVMTATPVAQEFPFTISGTDDVTQIDQTGPYFDETAPASGTRYNPSTGVLSFHVKDQHSSLDTTNIDVWVGQNVNGLAVGDVQIVNASTIETSATWPAGNKTVISDRDIRYDFTRVTDYAQQSTVVVSGELTDLANPVSNQSIVDYRFTILGSGTIGATISGAADGDPPIVLLGYPEDLDTQVSPNTQISWSVTDNAAGVDPTTLKFYINGSLKIEDDLATVGQFSRIANTERGFDYVYTPQSGFAFGTTVTGVIQVDDYVGNSAEKSYKFDITPDESLLITNFSIGQGDSIVMSSGTDISVCVEDFTHGVSTGGTYILANGLPPLGLVTTISGAGPDKITYTFPATGTINARVDVDVFVHAENNFPGPYPVIQEQNFLLRPGYDVEWWNRSTGIGGGAETVFPFSQNVQVLAEVLNFGKNFNQADMFYRFLTESQTNSDLGATLVSNIQVADLPAYLNSLNTIFEYGKTIVLEVEVADNNGNQLSFTHTFTIEDKPTN